MDTLNLNLTFRKILSHKNHNIIFNGGMKELFPLKSEWDKNVHYLKNKRRKKTENGYIDSSWLSMFTWKPSDFFHKHLR